MSIRIEEQGKSPLPPVEAKPSQVDLQDAFAITGVIFGEIGAWLIYRPAAFVLAALFCFGFVFLIERAKSRKPNGNH